MPALVVCGYRSKLAGDDLSTVCIITATLRLLEVLMLVPAATFTIKEYQFRVDVACMGGRSNLSRVGILPVPYVALSLFFAALTVVLSIWMYQIAGKGSPTQPEMRKGLSTLFAYQLFVMPCFLLIFVAVGISGVVYLRGRLECVGFPGSKPNWYFLLLSTIIFQCFELAIYAFVILRWLRTELRQRITKRKQNAPETIESKAAEWDRCCKCCCKYTALCCCFSFGGHGIQEEDFSSISQVLAELFDDGGTLDIVASDVIAAFMAISMEQEEKQRKWIDELKKEARENSLGSSNGVENLQTTSRAVILTENLRKILNIAVEMDIEAGVNERKKIFTYTGQKNNESGKQSEQFTIRHMLSPKDESDQYAVAEGARFLRYSIAINTAKGYLFNNLLMNSCKLAYGRCYEMPKHRSETVNKTKIVGKDAFGLNEAAFMKVVGFDTTKIELRYAHFDNNVVHEAVYCIVVDHVWKSIVLCIRGSLSLEDYVVNLNVEPTELDQVGRECGFDGKGEYCHTGYLTRAKWLCADLKRHGILDRLLEKESGEFRDYSLRVCGHSLGAGTAAPVALMLRNQYPDLRCLCFAPPGGLFSKGLAENCQEFITTCVINSDLVPRISPRAVVRMRDKVLQMIARIKVPKRTLIRMHRSADKVSDLPCGMKDLLYDVDEIPSSKFKTQLDNFQLLQTEKMERSGPNVPLHPPGKFIHFVKTTSSEEQRIVLQGRFMMHDLFNCFTCDRFVAEEGFMPTHAEISDFDEIVMASTLISDHMVESVEAAFDSTARVFGVDPSEAPPPRDDSHR